MNIDLSVISRLEKQYALQARYQKYGNAILIFSFLLLLLAGGIVKYQSYKAIERIELDRNLLNRQHAAIDQLEFALQQQARQLAKKDSIIAAQKELISEQAGYIQMLKEENRILKAQNIYLKKQLRDEVEMDTINSPLNQRRQP